MVSVSKIAQNFIDLSKEQENRIQRIEINSLYIYL